MYDVNRDHYPLNKYINIYIYNIYIHTHTHHMVVGLTFTTRFQKDFVTS